MMGLLLAAERGLGSDAEAFTGPKSATDTRTAKYLENFKTTTRSMESGSIRNHGMADRTGAARLHRHICCYTPNIDLNFTV